MFTVALLSLAALISFDDPLRDAALDTARWLRARAIETEHGLACASTPERSNRPDRTLYAGSPGVLLFFLELHRVTGDDSFRADAIRIADDLLANVDEIAKSQGTGLYTGVAGVGFALDRTHAATKLERYARGVERVLEHLERSALTSHANDVIAGHAGVGFYLLQQYREHASTRALRLARSVGDRLLERKRAKHDGDFWDVGTGAGPRNTYPNFSHGAAGIGAFLIDLYDATRDTRYRDAALGAARYLIAIADTSNDGLRVPRFDPDEYAQGESPLYYLSWCHGPAGTARFFHRLGEVTEDEDWFAWRNRAGHGLLSCALPERQEGFWNNVGVCCGNVGIAEFALAMHRRTKQSAYEDLLDALTKDLLQRTRKDQSGRSWVHAEHRVRPEDLAAQTGYMQGAAGIGTFLLRLEAYRSGNPFPLHLPDDPWQVP